MAAQYKKDILIISQFVDFPEEKGNDRFCYLANMLCDRGNNVEIITSDFIHIKKEHRHLKKEKYKYNYQLIHEPSYKKNICLRRFYSHYVFSQNVKTYLKSRRKPDVIYCAIPSLDVANVAAEYARKNRIKFIVDIQDLWPEAFQMVFHAPVVSNVIFKPFEIVANKVYKNADEIIAVSDTYVKRALKVNKKCKKGNTVFLGTRLSDFDENVRANPIDRNLYKDFFTEETGGRLLLAYCGTLGSSYDLTCVIDALQIVKQKGETPPKFIVMGDGPRKKEFEDYAKAKGVEALFTGRLPYSHMCGMLSACDMTVNPITKGAAQSIINKHADYAASSLPVLNTQECEEYRTLVQQYHMGFNCNNNDAQDLAEKMMILIGDSGLRREMGRNARRCAEEKFDRENSYNKLIDIIQGQEE